MEMLSKQCVCCAELVHAQPLYKLYLARFDEEAMQMEVDGYLCPACYRLFGRALMRVMGKALAQGFGAVQVAVHRDSAVQP